MTLNGTELLVIATKTMRFSDEEALTYLKDKNKEISRSTYYRILGKVDVETKKRLFDICKNFTTHHLERIDALRVVEKELWVNYHAKKSIIIQTREDGYDENNKKYSKTTAEVMQIDQTPTEKTKILKDITELQPYISAYEEATQSIMEKSIVQFGREESMDLSFLDQ